MQGEDRKSCMGIAGHGLCDKLLDTDNGMTAG